MGKKMLSKKKKKSLICYVPQAGLNYRPIYIRLNSTTYLLGANADDAFVEPFLISLFFTKCVAP